MTKPITIKELDELIGKDIEHRQTLKEWKADKIAMLEAIVKIYDFIGEGTEPIEETGIKLKDVWLMLGELKEQLGGGEK